MVGMDNDRSNAQATFPLSEAARKCVGAFDHLTASLESPDEQSDGKLHSSVVKHQRDRFKIWAATLGALQRGRASLDFRLNETSLTKTTVLRFLEQLQQILLKSDEVVQGHRLPLEKTIESDSEYNSDESSISSSSENDIRSNDLSTRTELGQNTAEVDQILSSLVRLSFRIRGPNSRTAQADLKAVTHKEIVPVEDSEPVDLMSSFETFDRQYVDEVFRQIRREVSKGVAAHRSDAFSADGSPSTGGTGDSATYLRETWSKSITNRRRVFAYWRRHARKLAEEEPSFRPREMKARQPQAIPITAESARVPEISALLQNLAPSQAPSSAVRTALSGTEATMYRGDDVDLDAGSVVSYASTAFDTDGVCSELPPPPSLKPGQMEFVCSVCHVLCPARDAKGTRWRDHISRDIQPYMCTYAECPEFDTMHSSKATWLEHESRVHRKIWRCFEHKDLFRSRDALIGHLETSHATLGQAQIQSMASLAQAGTTDERETCPFCLSSGPFETPLTDHMALHMERLASFSIPRHILEEDVPTRGTNSGAAQGDRSESSLLDVSLKFSDINSKASSSADVASLRLNDPFESNVQSKQERDNNPPEASSITDDMSAFDYYLQQRHPGTWQWFLNSTGHQTWLSHVGEKRLVLGVPGVGKSVLASVVLEDLRQRFKDERSVGVVGLFCEVYDQDGVSEKLAESFITQLRGVKRSNFASYEESGPLDVGNMSWHAFWATSHVSKVFIVIDGLDLQARDTKLYDWLLAIVVKQPKINVFVTSRIVPTTHDALLDFPIQDLRATEADISAYARKSIDTAIASNMYPGQLAELEERTVTFAEGVFLFAKAHIDASKNSQRTEHLSNLVLLQNSRVINDFYESIMLRVQKSKMGNTLSAWMAHSDFILEKPQVQNLIGFVLNDCTSDSGTFLDVNTVISSCAGLVLESSENCLTFFHHTTEAYFRQTRDKWFPDAAEEQAEICCKYLCMDAFAAGPCLSDDEWEERLAQHPFYIHAALAWGLHARKALEKHKDETDTAARDRVYRAIMNFLRSDVKVQAAVQALKVDDTESHSSGWSQVYPKQWTNIHLAAYFGLTEVLDTILDTILPEDDAIWDTSIDGIYSPIIVAAERGHHSTLSFMLGKLIDRTGRPRTGLYGMVSQLALAGAAQNGHEANVRLLLTYDADPNGASGSITPLYYAVKHGHTDVVETLLEYGADPNLKTDVEGPLGLAFKNGHDGIVTLLMKHGASFDKTNPDLADSTIQQIGISPEIIPFMLKEGVGVNYRNEDGFTALHLCAINGDIEAVRILLDNGADASIMDNDGATSLEYAMDAGNEGVVDLILERISQ